jgi:hypothetical protein
MTARHGMVASASGLASQVGVDTLKRVDVTHIPSVQAGDIATLLATNGTETIIAGASPMLFRQPRSGLRVRCRAGDESLQQTLV